ncbi:MAG: SIS domain-containing protein [Candidatus Neomarinimicrobiota bacterium]|tara:strand:- start:1079 stop:1663 length:585 start_codon:yes stop_codon:yes gene_type:complete
MIEQIKNQILESNKLYLRIIESCMSDIELSINIINNSVKQNKKILWCGNRGSAAICQYLTYELMSEGMSVSERKPISSIALNTDGSLLTISSDDNGSNSIFSRQIQGLGDENDVLVGLSDSGNSKNIISAFKQAKFKGLKTIALTGNYDNQLEQIGDASIRIPTTNPQKIQLGYLKIGQVICSQIEDTFLLLNE